MKTLKFYLPILILLFLGQHLQAQNNIHDADNDTRVTTEAVADEDQIRFYLNGTQRWSISPVGQFVTSNSNRNIRIGYNTGNSLTTGADNMFIGFRAGQTTTSASGNVGIGKYTLQDNTTGYSNIALGVSTLANNTTGYSNMGIGTSSLLLNTTGSNNTAVGVGALSLNVSGLQNIAIGTNSLYKTTSSSNIGIGYQAGFNNTSGNNNIFIGNKTGLANTTGVRNTLIGSSAGHLATGSNNVFIGYQAGYNETNSNKLYIDNTSTTSPLIYGDFTTNEAAINGELGVGTKTPARRIHAYDAGNAGDVMIEDSYPFLILQTTSTGNKGIIMESNTGANEAEIFHGADLLRIHTGGAGNNASGINIDADNFMGLGTAAPDAKLHVAHAGTSSAYGTIYAENTNTTNVHVKAIRGVSVPADGYGYGGFFQGGFIGSYNRANGGASTGSTYGVYGTATGTAGTRYGVYGTASGGTTNYAVYGNGDIKAASQMFIGTTTTMESAASSYELLVDGEIICEELKVEDSGTWPDYVFDAKYELPSLEEVDAFIKENKHLPNIPSAKVIESEGFLIGQMHNKTIEKVEELTLYAIDADKRIKVLEQQNQQLQQAVNDLLSQLQK